MKDLPGVSCICPTFNRPPRLLWLLEEAVESFLRQEYEGPSELLVLSDAAGQELKCDAPGVRVINLPSRCASLGEKYNFAVAMAKYDLICPWEDDDISLPHRLRLSVQRVESRSYYNPRGYFFRTYKTCVESDTRVCGDPVSVHHPIGVSHNCSIFSRNAWREVGGYSRVSGAQDSIIDSALSKLLSAARTLPVTMHEFAYVYRWGVQPHHLSGRSPHDAFYADIGKHEVERGTFQIVPKWYEDYSELCARAVRENT